MNPIIFLGLMLVLVWLLLIMPARRRQQAQRKVREIVSPGEQILTAGGIYATVREVREHDLTVEIAPGIEVRLDRRAIAVSVQEVPEEADGVEREEAAAAEPRELEPAAVQESAVHEEPALDEEPERAARS